MGEDNIAREVRCVCGGAFCIVCVALPNNEHWNITDSRHRSQEAHECTAPRELSARNDAVMERRDKAKELLAKHFPQQAARERAVMPQQVDKTRSAPPPSQSSQPQPMDAAATPITPVPPAPAPAPARSADEKLYKLHLTKIRSLARPLDAKVSRDASAAVEFVVDEGGDRVRVWTEAEGKYAPTAVAAALGTAKPERIWVPIVRPSAIYSS